MREHRGLVSVLGALLLLLSGPLFAQRTIAPMIFGGEWVSQSAAPWAAQLFSKISESSQLILGEFCGASLIDLNYVLTAAHCLHNSETGAPFSSEAIYIEIDNVIFTHPYKRKYKAAEIHIHPSYEGSSNNYLHDIALIRLSKTAPSTTAILPVYSGLPEPTILLSAYGWGQTENKKETTSGILQSTRLQYVSSSSCYWDIDNSSLCAISPQNTEAEYGNDTCFGDSGGPLTYKVGGQEYLLGITSYSDRACGTKPMDGYEGTENDLPIPGVYLRPAAYQRWIDAIIQGEEPTEEDILPDIDTSEDSKTNTRRPPVDSSGSISGTAFTLLISLYLRRRLLRH